MLKRSFDVLFSALALAVLALPMLVVALVVRLKLGRPVLFRQERPGLNGRPFRMLKFRTMTDQRDSRGDLLPDVERLHPVGQFLRATSLDELPELWNVLRGDMSFVGPRPLLMGYLDLYSDRQRRRHEARPGITGWAQVNGRNNVPWAERFEMDLWYVENRTFVLDLKILLLTVLRVVRREGINPDQEQVMAPFRGNEQPERN